MTNSTNVTPQLFSFLARLWIAEPDEFVLQSLNEDATRKAWQSLGGYVPDVDSEDELAIEYCGCFIGPSGHLPPHQSVVIQSHFQGDCLSSLNQFIDIVGLPDEPLFQRYHSMPDHAGILLWMMGQICEEPDSSDVEELRIAFYQHHLQWLVEYCKVARSRTNSEFYRGLFYFTEEFLITNRPTI